VPFDNDTGVTTVATKIMSEQLSCPSCRATMEPIGVARNAGGTVCVDVCWTCQAIWFDAHESTQLAPDGVVALLKAINQNRQAGQPVAMAMHCPRCASTLTYVQDMTRNGRFAYHHCTFAHGRFTPFNQFLIEKGFIRALNGAEIAALKAQIKVVCCSGCGAPVDLQRDTVCSQCHAPIAILDVHALDKALAAYEGAAKPKPVRDYDVVADMLMRQEHQRLAGQHAGSNSLHAIDLIACGMRGVVEWWE
jgi:Zn-finger nucleic acid-binding protein